MTKEEIIEQVTNSAFPQTIHHHNVVSHGTGLTKREIFAAMALQGILASGTANFFEEKNSEWAVRQADALIKALNETK